MKFILAATALAIVSSTAVLAKECKLPYVAKKDDTCQSVAEANHVNVKQFYKLNFAREKGEPISEDDCSKLIPGKTYCLDPKNKRDWFYKTRGLTGQKLALAKKKIAAKKTTKKTTKKHTKKTTKKAAKKTTKKPTKKTTKKTTKKATTTKKTSPGGTGAQSRPGMDWSSTPKNAPSNAVRHIIPSCTKYATVDTSYSWCGDFAQRNGVTLPNLYKYNAGLHGPGKHECDNLDDGKAYCVKA